MGVHVVAVYRPKEREEALETARQHPEVLSMWERFGECCDHGTLADLPNATTLFPEFDLVGSY